VMFGLVSTQYLAPSPTAKFKSHEKDLILVFSMPSTNSSGPKSIPNDFAISLLPLSCVTDALGSGHGLHHSAHSSCHPLIERPLEKWAVEKWALTVLSA